MSRSATWRRCRLEWSLPRTRGEKRTRTSTAAVPVEDAETFVMTPANGRDRDRGKWQRLGTSVLLRKYRNTRYGSKLTANSWDVSVCVGAEKNQYKSNHCFKMIIKLNKCKRLRPNAPRITESLQPERGPVSVLWWGKAQRSGRLDCRLCCYWTSCWTGPSTWAHGGRGRRKGECS